MDALGAFSFLSDNVPTWIGQLSDLAAHTAAKHTEYANAYKRHAALRTRRRKNSSVCSIHTDDLTLPSTATLSPSSAAEAREGTALTTPNTSQTPSNSNPRKRGAEDALSVDSNEQGIFVSTRHNLIIEYDGHTQKVLEEMVRNIGTARNNIRKGKMSQLRTAGYRSAVLIRSSRMSPLAASLASPGATEDDVLSSIRKARTQGPPTPRTAAPPQPSPLDMAEKQLELAHVQCETAAYHFLRSGECSAELASVEQKLKGLLDLATQEVRRLKTERPETPTVQEEKPPAVAPQPAMATTTIDGDRHSMTKMDTIEVDDGSESSESIDLTVFRANRIRR
ncbi:uncharacterized protein BO97DRAFT_343696 [Aspergillus homomorphus CBS 101889]|uniref:Uncharacterized protein n=1 Tax=Aspergillus homomorphus (strain CBS 101889) TaxID=1450537 RepID=A0A395HY69_ASPHC|nr:hypothetical protein BO97DRAFT_343696 [Aspergillus homomorphus CBS 101889]RAL12871.1 hypothetical protein BO97DRAFT_343696 [Aspergillus homomorphus CBS 101889]